ncbi:MAG: 5-exo-hydroxycamphor dehydrogenase [Syntrophaceae bacterium PtaU1.Bin231]|nr:MAG: 5-exo-hydroxycamphor dehydrogenase [Syntrophaceae bacterium PtaU1.Bin231]
MGKTGAEVVKGRLAALVGPTQIQIQEYPLPDVEKGAVLTKVLRSNLCGSELHIWHWTHPLIKNAVLGHEMIAQIEVLGEGVENDYAGTPVKKGDRVVAPYYLTCQKCGPCSRGDFHMCLNAYRWWSQPPDKYPHFTGTFATHYYIQPGQYFYRVPDELPSSIVAGANCGLSQVLFGLEKAALTSGEHLVIMGAGGLGLYATAVGKDKGAIVTVVDAIASRLTVAKSFGADHTVDLQAFSGEALTKKILEITGGAGADVVLEVAGVSAAFTQGIQLVRTCGRLISIGNVSIDKKFEVPLAPGWITRKSVNIIGVVRYNPWYLLKSLKFLQRTFRNVDYEQLTDATFSLDQVQEALEKSEKRIVTRAVIVPNP